MCSSTRRPVFFLCTLRACPANDLIEHAHVERSKHLIDLAQEHWEDEHIIFSRGLFPALDETDCLDAKKWESCDLGAIMIHHILACDGSGRASGVRSCHFLSLIPQGDGSLGFQERSFGEPCNSSVMQATVRTSGSQSAPPTAPTGYAGEGTSRAGQTAISIFFRDGRSGTTDIFKVESNQGAHTE